MLLRRRRERDFVVFLLEVCSNSSETAILVFCMTRKVFILYSSLNASAVQMGGLRSGPVDKEVFPVAKVYDSEYSVIDHLCVQVPLAMKQHVRFLPDRPGSSIM